MSAMLQNPMVRQEPEQSSAAIEAEYRDQLATTLASVNAEDVLNELADAENSAALETLMANGDALAIGRLVLTVRKAYALRLMKFWSEA